MVIIGGGVISVEFATVYAALGSRVKILEAMRELFRIWTKKFPRI